jgi:hypothetical protein
VKQTKSGHFQYLISTCFFNISKGCGLTAIYLVGLFVCENKTPQKWRFVCVGFEG